MIDYLGEALAAEEHRQGKPIGDDAEHCDDCAAEVERRLQAECEHDGEQTDVTMLDRVGRQLLCPRCGLIREVLEVTALLYLLGAVAGCAAPLWCRVRGHEVRPAGWSGVIGVEQCGRCGREWLVGMR